ncbi:hypothetical protein BGZ57DRAFT_945016 [Hyaloscypha finlandica]|nr:hypothetical protein BGZ57DRAFT_945016 [Hyaloscypha finlandica]
MTSEPPFFVVARVVGRDGAFELWKQRLVRLCEVSATEPLGNTYYWGQDLNGEPDTLWGLEGYSHAVGFFIGHPSSQVFKEEMALVDSDKLLRHEQGLASKDYDLKHYDQVGGYLTREDDEGKDGKDSFVVVMHFWESCQCDKGGCGSRVRGHDSELRCVQGSLGPKLGYTSVIDVELIIGGDLVEKTEVHRSKAFNGHIDK